MIRGFLRGLPEPASIVKGVVNPFQMCVKRPSIARIPEKHGGFACTLRPVVPGKEQEISRHLKLPFSKDKTGGFREMGYRERAGRRAQRRGERRAARRMRTFRGASLFLLLAGLGVVMLVAGLATRYLPEEPRDAAGAARQAAPAEARPEGEAGSRERHQTPPRDFDAAALRDRLAEISAGYEGRSGIVVFDPVSNRGVSLGADEEFTAASIGKLPTLMTLYKAADRGELSLEEEIAMMPQDVMSYGTGVLHNEPVGHSLTLRECAFLLVNKSDNTAWEMLERRLGMGTIQAELYESGIRSTDYSWGTTTPGDVLMMLMKISDPAFTGERLSGEMLAAMTNTNLEDRLPAPLPPESTRVAHKTGSYEDSFGDAGIVFYKDNRGVERRYFVVVLTQGMGEDAARREIGEVSLAAHEAIAAPESGRFGR